MKRKLICIVMISMFLLTSAFSSAAVIKNTEQHIEATLSNNQAYTPHDPIVIDGNGDFTAANGVTGGSGTEFDPYVIEDWELATINIRNTTAYFIIRHCYVYGDDLDERVVDFLHVENGTVQDCIIEPSGSNFWCLFIDWSNNLVIEYCNVYNGFVGVNLKNSEEITIHHCEILNCEYIAFQLVLAQYNTIHSCNLSGDEFDETDYGFVLAYSSYNIIYHNNVANFLDNADSDGMENWWDYGAEGNYWDDYSGIDWNGDGIGDQPDYYITLFERDRYPLMGPYPDAYNNHQASQNSQSNPQSQQSTTSSSSSQLLQQMVKTTRATSS